MSASHRRFSSWLPQPTRLGQQSFSLSIKRVRQSDGGYHGADEATLIEKSYNQLASRTGRFRWDAFVEQGFNFSGRAKFSTSKLNLSAWNKTHLTPHVKYHDGASVYETSDGRDGERDRHKKYSHPQRRYDTIMNKRGGPLLPVETQEDSSGFLGTRLLNRDLRNLSYQSTHTAICHDTKQQTSRVQQFNKPVSSPVTENFQRHSPPLQEWQVQKRALFEKFGSSGWSPRKRLAPDVLESIRALNLQSPEKYTTPVLAEQFEVSPEAIRRILKSKWRPNEGEQVRRQLRWEKRGKAIWSQMVEIGIKPPKKWRVMGVKKK